MGDTTIEWTDKTWNPVAGCSVHTPGCTNCYAMKMAARLEAMGMERYAGLTKPTKGGPVWTGIVRGVPEALKLPLRWRKPAMIFVNSMSDLFHEEMPVAAIDRAVVVMALTPRHTYQVLTKRPDVMHAYWTAFSWRRAVENCRNDRGASVIAKHSINDLERAFGLVGRFTYDRDCSVVPLPNVWLGTSVEDELRAHDRRRDLRALAKAGWATWVSYEPALGPVDWAGWEFLKWLVSSGESGPKARPSHPDWHRATRDFCSDAGVAFHFKQWGEFREFDTGSPIAEEIDADDEVADAFLALADRPSWITRDGKHITRRADLPDDETPCRLIERVGKKAAGRLLDGRTHDGFPK